MVVETSEEVLVSLRACLWSEGCRLGNNFSVPFLGCFPSPPHFWFLLWLQHPNLFPRFLQWNRKAGEIAELLLPQTRSCLRVTHSQYFLWGLRGKVLEGFPRGTLGISWPELFGELSSVFSVGSWWKIPANFWVLPHSPEWDSKNFTSWC